MTGKGGRGVLPSLQVSVGLAKRSVPARTRRRSPDAASKPHQNRVGTALWPLPTVLRLFDANIATFGEDGGACRQADAAGFGKLNTLHMRIAANGGRKLF